MHSLFDMTNLKILVCAIVLTLLCLHPMTIAIFPFSLLARGMDVGDVLFHEMGHTIFNWLFGIPAIPMIFTIFGADQAGGLSLSLTERSTASQLIALTLLALGCAWLRREKSTWFMPALTLLIIVGLFSLIGQSKLIILYMGHGSSILMGGFFLYRAILYLDARGPFERWLNAFFGCYLLARNFTFSYGLAFNAATREAYTRSTIFGAAHHDFVAMTEELPRLSVAAIAQGTLVYCIIVALVSIAWSYYRRNDY